MTRCADCSAIVSDDEDYAELEDLRRICAACVTRGLNPHWAGPRDIDRSQKQSAKVKEARAEGNRKYDHVFAGAKAHG